MREYLACIQGHRCEPWNKLIKKLSKEKLVDFTVYVYVYVYVDKKESLGRITAAIPERVDESWVDMISLYSPTSGG